MRRIPVISSVVIILLAVIAAGCGKKEEKLQVKRGLAARIDDTKLTEEYVDAKFEALGEAEKKVFDGIDGKSRFVDKLIEERLLYKEALSKNLHNDEEIKEQIEQSERNVMLSYYYQNEVVAKIEVGDDEVKKYYDANQEEFKTRALMRAQHIFSEDSMKCVRWKKRLDGGENFSVIAKEESEDQMTAIVSGSLGYFNPGGYIKSIGFSQKFSAAVEDLEIGEISDVIAYEKGYSIVKINEKVPSKIQPLAEVHKQIVDKLSTEYFAVRSGCSVMDLTPMEKYRIEGPDARAYLDKLVTRDLSKLRPGRVTYVAWCNDDGKVIDDGTLFQFDERRYRLCAQHHQLDWLLMSAAGFEVDIAVETHDVAALAVQGPTSYSVLAAAGIAGLEELAPFGLRELACGDVPVVVSRTGYTGDLGYELWVEPEHAPALWNAIFSVRGRYDIHLIGLDALEMVRIEAGFIMPGFDFNCAEATIRDGYDRSPYEVGLGWIVHLDKGHFTGRRALEAERARPPARRSKAPASKPPRSSPRPSAAWRPITQFACDRASRGSRPVFAPRSATWMQPCAPIAT